MKHTAPTTTLEIPDMAQYRIYHNHTSHCNHTGFFIFSYHAEVILPILHLFIFLLLLSLPESPVAIFSVLFLLLFCVIFINWCFTYPYFKVNFQISGYPVTFVFLLSISLIISTLTTQLKKQDKMILKESVRSMRQTKNVYVPIFCGQSLMIFVHRLLLL